MSLNNFIEVQQLGYNFLTVAFVGTVVFTFLQVWGLWKQTMRIRELKSIQSVSIPCLAYFAVHFSCQTVFGLRHDRLAYVVDGAMLAIMHVLVLDMAIRHGAKLGASYIVAFISAVSLFYALPTPFDYYCMTACYFIAAYFVWLIPFEILRNNTQGAVSAKLLLSVFITVTFWTVFGWCVSDWMLVVSCGISLLGIAWAFYLCATCWLQEVTHMNEGV